MNIHQLTDRALEATIVGSFSSLGYAARSRTGEWDDVDADLTGQRAIVTGSTSGIGRAIAQGLAAMGADVVVTSRDQERADAAAEEIAKAAGAGSAEGLALDTADFDSVRSFVAEVASGHHVDILVHNAGALTDEYRTNEQGMEMTLASHLVGPYLITTQLRPHMAKGARVLWMSSGGMYTQSLDLDRLEMGEDDYRGSIAYARAKRAQVELVAHLGPQWYPDVVMHAAHPGWVDTPGVEQGLPGFRKVMGPILRDPAQGADTMLWLATTGGDGGQPGSFWHDRRPRRTAYLPGTSATTSERKDLVEWLDLVTLPATAGS